MYNLFITGDENRWEGNIYSLSKDRCIRKNEYTATAIAEKLGNFSLSSIETLKNLPCLFAYEGFHEAPKFGWLKSIKEKSDSILLEFKTETINPWINVDQFEAISPFLDVIGFERYRTHWAVKDVSLQEVLGTLGLSIPSKNSKVVQLGNPAKLNFDVAFSFPGESRKYVEAVLLNLKQLLPLSQVFYDLDFQAHLARPELDSYLGKIYRNQSKLLVVFLSANYQKKKWCGVEWRVIKEVIFNREHDRVMLIKTDDGEVDGVLATDGYIDARMYSPEKVANFISQRLSDI